MDYKDRMKIEYAELKERSGKLTAMLEKYKAGTLDFTPNCSYELLYEQLIYMRQYLRILDKCVKIENVDVKDGQE